MKSFNGKTFSDLIIDNSYFKWIERVLEEEEILDDVFYYHNGVTSEEEKFYLKNLRNLFKKLYDYSVKYNKNHNFENAFKYYVKYNDSYYEIGNDGECTYVEKSIPIGDFLVVVYEDFRKYCKKNMVENFENLKDSISYSLSNSDLEKINYELKKIDKPTLVSGVGGSSVVSEYGAKILSDKNNIIARNTEPRDFMYMNTKPYKNVVSCSYSGKNYGVDLAFLNNLKHYLLASKESNREDVTSLTYNLNHKETSFISLSATLIPCSILLNYYLDNKNGEIIDSINNYHFNFDCNCDCYEIFSGFDTSVLSTYLDSTMTEAGIGIPVVHDKYSYCHGRSTLSIVKNNIAIYFNCGKELDKLYLEELPKYYKDVIVIDTKDNLLDEYKALVKCIHLTKYIAEKQSKDLSGVDYSPIVKKLYYYNKEL